MLLDRREFLTWTVAGAFVLAIARAADDVTTEGTLAAWIRIHPDGRVTL
jgi:hypothetical protein